MNNYIRFVVGTNQESPTIQTGLITELRFLKEESELHQFEIDFIEETFEWLNDNLPCPPYETHELNNDAISWFKDSSKVFIDKFWEIKSLLEDYGKHVRILTTDEPGIIYYEDEFQIVSESENW
ncbi:hypothetical protein PQO03_11465 [Lentisphaera profundi]|uniref:Uncharacterized protein n=1 Tax=Lentisphaera profundi TaxID=1658616 RepID=A0ABY7VTV9_9BACT|nr:hypothetical protein [Lentisphaera profundi]WDE96327.1 hypothetical protein PQO03_11465 [Lentisphaera profundi]